MVPVRNGIDDETLCQGDPRALEVVESWERLIRQVCLRLGGELGQKVLPVQRAKRGTDPKPLRDRLADQLCLEGKLQAKLRIEGTPGVLAISADLRTGKLRTSIEIPVPWLPSGVGEAARSTLGRGTGGSPHRNPRRRGNRRPARNTRTAPPRAGGHAAQGERHPDRRLQLVPLQEHGKQPWQCGVRFHPQRRRRGTPLLHHCGGPLGRCDASPSTL